MEHEADNTAARLAEKRHQMILEALAEVDAGRFLEHQEIEDWLASLPDDGGEQGA